MDVGEEKKPHAAKFSSVHGKEKALCTVCPYANVGQMILMLSAQSACASLSVAVK